jgi:hypothetical protein
MRGGETLVIISADSLCVEVVTPDFLITAYREGDTDHIIIHDEGIRTFTWAVNHMSLKTKAIALACHMYGVVDLKVRVENIPARRMYHRRIEKFREEEFEWETLLTSPLQ